MYIIVQYRILELIFEIPKKIRNKLIYYKVSFKKKKVDIWDSLLLTWWAQQFQYFELCGIKKYLLKVSLLAMLTLPAWI